MSIDYPASGQIHQLRSLWKAAFGDDDAFLDIFFSTAYSPRRCRCITENGQVLAALYWFETLCEGQNFAYLYAVATDPGCRNRGLCRTLMADTKQLLAEEGFHGILLVPQNEGLSRMYEKMGFAPCTTITEFRCSAIPVSVPLRQVDAEEYARLRRSMLPGGSVLQEGADLALLAAQAAFYAGPDFLAVVSSEGKELRCHELLGPIRRAHELLGALGCESGLFRTPGPEKPFASFLPLRPGCTAPAYFGLALD